MSQGNLLNHTKMKQDMFKHLPSEIVIDILSRLPVRSVIRCKCVQKSWLHITETREFVKSHISKSASGLIMWEYNWESSSRLFKLFEFEDGFDVEHHDLHYKLVAKFSTDLGRIEGSVDGLLLLHKHINLAALYICNPITCDYINLHFPHEFRDPNYLVTWGFGSSKITCQYKVVRIVHGHMSNQLTLKGQITFEAESYVYTLGTELWRRCASCNFLKYNINTSAGVFVNGNLHWLVSDLDHCLRISCFDLETEHFSTFSAPSLHWDVLNLIAWRDCLGLCDNSSDDETVIWVMKEYGVEKSWTKEIVIGKVGMCIDMYRAEVYLIKVFRDGDILIKPDGSAFIYYSSKTETTRKVDMFNLPNTYLLNSYLCTPSFLSLKSFSLDVSSLK